MKKRMTIVFFILTVLLTVFIFSNSCQYAADSSEQSAKIVNNIPTFVDVDKSLLTVITRKLAHIIEFFLQSIFACLFFISLNRFYKNIIYVLFTGLFTACIDEFLQTFFSGRAAMISDIFIDFSGTVLGIIFCIILYSLFKKYKRKNHEGV